MQRSTRETAEAHFNANGEVVGINTAKVATDTVEGMGYAIPISSVSDIIENLMNQETKTKVSEAEQGQLGIQGVDVTADSSEMYNMPTGVYVSEVIAGGGSEESRNYKRISHHRNQRNQHRWYAGFEGTAPVLQSRRDCEDYSGNTGEEWGIR